MVNHYKHFGHLHVPDSWEQYWSKYPNGYSILESLINWVGQVDDMVDHQNKTTATVTNYGKRLDDFIGKYEGNLQKTVENTISEWQKSGFIDVVINAALDTKYHMMDARLSNQISSESKAREQEIDRLENKKANMVYVDEKISQLGGFEIKGAFPTLIELQTKYPKGEKGLYVVTSLNKWFYWNGTSWEPGNSLDVTPWGEFMTTNGDEWRV